MCPNSSARGSSLPLLRPQLLPWPPLPAPSQASQAPAITDPCCFWSMLRFFIPRCLVQARAFPSPGPQKAPAALSRRSQDADYVGLSHGTQVKLSLCAVFPPYHPILQLLANTCVSPRIALCFLYSVWLRTSRPEQKLNVCGSGRLPSTHRMRRWVSSCAGHWRSRG